MSIDIEKGFNAMTLTQEIDRERRARLEALAHDAGLSMEEYVWRVVDQAAGQKMRGDGVGAVSPAERAARFQELADSHGHDTPLLTDDAISREAIYSRD